MNKNIINTLIGLVIGGTFLFLTLYNKPLSNIVDSISEANLYWTALSGIILFSVFYLRALRWKVILDNSEETTTKSSVFHSLMLGYFVNSFTPKLGEIVRCTSLSKSEGVPVSKALGTVVSERVYDMIILFLGIVVIFFIEIERLSGILNDMISGLTSTFYNNKILFLAGVGVMILGIFIFLKLSKKIKLFEKIKEFLSEMLNTVKKTFKIKQYKRFIVLTILIWSALVLMNFTFLMALPDTHSFSLYFAVVILFIGGIGWALPSPGGIGTTHIIILQLFVLFNLNENIGVAFGVFSNGVTFIYTILFGVASITLNKYNKKRIILEPIPVEK